jgi:hypothetical protein
MAQRNICQSMWIIAAALRRLQHGSATNWSGACSIFDAEINSCFRKLTHAMHRVQEIGRIQSPTKRPLVS